MGQGPHSLQLHGLDSVLRSRTEVYQSQNLKEMPLDRIQRRQLLIADTWKDHAYPSAAEKICQIMKLPQFPNLGHAKIGLDTGEYELSDVS